MTCDLQGMSVLVTRPQDQADGLCSLIEKAHGRPVRFPAMEIVPLDRVEARQVLADIAATDFLVFISANAVTHAFPLLPEELPVDLRIAAIGDATARGLEAVGLPVTLKPEGRFDSEGLLSLPQLQNLDGCRIVIVRGRGGREKLRDGLEARGAQVRYAEVYERRRPRRDARNLLKGWDDLVNAVAVTSSEILDNLCRMLGEEGTEKLRRTPLVVLSERTAEHAFNLGCQSIWVTEQAGDRGILRALCEIREELS